MTLLRQITIVFTIFFLVMLGAVLTVTFEDARDYIQNELFTKAQNTASTLAVAMSQEGGDEGKLAAMAEAVYDTGYYRAIVLKTMDGKEIFSEKREAKRVVPDWFERIIRLHPQTAAAQVSNGWTPFAILKVTADVTESKLYLYTYFKKMVGLFTVAALVAWILIYLLLKMILRPINGMEQQAKEVLQNRFVIIEKLPRTVELRRMVQAMNDLVARMKDMHERLVTLTRRNWELEYTDPLTNLNNRRYFLVRYTDALRSEDIRPEGCVTVLHIANIEEANRRIGYDKVNELFKQIGSTVAKLASENRKQEWTACRISAMEFAMLMPQADVETAKKIAEEMIARTRAILNERFPEIRASVCLAAAVVPYDEKTSTERLLSTLDLTLQSALHHACDMVEVAQYSGALPTRKVAWRALIVSALQEGRLKAVFSNICIKKDASSARLAFDIIQNGETIPYRTFAPMLDQLDLTGAFVDYAIDYLKERYNAPYRRIALELTVDYLDRTHELRRLLEEAANLKKEQGIELIVEFAQSDLIRHDIRTVEAVAEALRGNGLYPAVVRFDANQKVLQMLRHLRPIYVKMEYGHLVDMGDNLRDSLFLLLRSVGVYLLVGGVDTSEKATRLDGFGIDWCGGKQLNHDREQS